MLGVLTGTYSGSCTYDATTCLKGGGGQVEWTGFSTPETENICAFGDSVIGAEGTFLESGTPTTDNLSVMAGCFDILYPDPSTTYEAQSVSSSAVATLTNEDTETDAITRVLAANPYGGWTPDMPPMMTCLSRWEIRTMGFDFIYEESQFMYVVTGLAPSTSYTLTLDVYESLFGMSSFSMTGTISAGFMSDSSGNATITGNFPITRGYDTYLDNPVVT